MVGLSRSLSSLSLGSFKPSGTKNSGDASTSLGSVKASPSSSVSSWGKKGASLKRSDSRGSLSPFLRRSNSSGWLSPRKPIHLATPPEFSEIRCCNYAATEQLGFGRFGEVWKGVNEYDKEEVAMKFAWNDMQAMLGREAEILTLLNETEEEVQGIPQKLHFSQEGTHACLITERLGFTFRDHMKTASLQGQTFSLQTTILIAEQVIQRIEYLHSKTFIHRDIKPENFMFGTGNKVHHVYLIDFGLCKSYWELPEDGQGKGSHVPHQFYDRGAGTPCYMSISAYRGYEQSRRDDLESIGYMLLEMVRGNLPWDNVFQGQIGVVKANTPITELCEGAPDEFNEYMEYCRGLDFPAAPDYGKLYGLFRQCRLPGTTDHGFDWINTFVTDVDKLEPLLPRVAYTQPEHVWQRTVSLVTKQGAPELKSDSKGLLRFFKGYGCINSPEKDFLEVSTDDAEIVEVTV